MAGRGGPGKRLSLLALIREHEELVEVDFARFYPGIDYLDRYRKTEAGRPRLSTRKLLLLVDHLPPESAFSSAVNERYPMSREQAAMYDLFAAFTGKPHPYPDALKQERKAKRKAERIAQGREERQAQNRRYLASARPPR